MARGPQTPLLVLDMDTGKTLPTPVALGVAVPAGPVAMSGDGRLAALSYTPLIPREVDQRLRGEGPKSAVATHSFGQTHLTVWDTATGVVVRSWPARVSAVAFHPTRPVLAVLEPHMGGTRLGLWDFSAQQ